MSAFDKTVSRVFQIFLGTCLLIMAAAGTANTFSLQTRGIKTQAEVLEMILDQHYRTTNWRHSVDYYKIKVQFLNQQSTQQDQWAQIELADQKKFNVAVGSQIPFIYIPGSERSMVGTEAPSWKEAVVWGGIFVSLGILLIVLAIFNKYPGANK